MEIRLKPLKLTLQGFTGIESGLGKSSFMLDFTTIPNDKQLVAIVGANGRGKTTLLDNMQPYRVMPSRSSTLGPGGFSYWDHISTSTASVELDWEHEGTTYRKAFSFKVSGKSKKADYYLFERDAASDCWVPVRLPDGTLSDGKAETYDQCVDAIVGPPERFFTSQFSAQKRRELSSYGASEVKTLLASILHLLSYRTLSAKAALVGKLLKTHLDSLYNDIAQSRGADEGIVSTSKELARLEERVNAQSTRESALEVAHHAAQQAAATLNARRSHIANECEERAYLTAKLQTLEETRQQVHKRLQHAFDNEKKGIAVHVNQVRKDREMAQSTVQKLNVEIAHLDELCLHKAKYLEAQQKLPLVKQSIAEIDLMVAKGNHDLSRFTAKQLQLNDLVRIQAEHNTAGQAKRLAIVRLEETASLVKTVPCHSSEWQSTCPLLAHANGAFKQIAPEQIRLAELREQYRDVNRKKEKLEAELQTAALLDKEIREAVETRTRLAQDFEALLEQAGRCDLIVHAESRKPAAIAERNAQEQALKDLKERESAQVGLLDQAAAKFATEGARADESAAIETTQVRERLTKLSAPISDLDVANAAQAVRDAADLIDEAKAMRRAISDQKVTMLAKIEIFKEIKARMQATVAEAAKLSNEIAKFKLLEKGLGNDGVVALSIDDAGPEISRLCNELLVEDFEGRFAIRLDTQRETQSGDVRETFQIAVFDSRGGCEKSLDDMSPGEQVSVNACLTRALALFVGQNGSCHYQTLFSDEADGPLDPDKKRQFIQTKRSVLKRGGYSREYFISQTPELWESADYIIDLNKI
jgi:exonuclease SbcC